jgi:hypothetical protein
MLPIVEQVNRAVQACHGISALSLPPSERETTLRTYTEATYKTLEVIQTDISQAGDDASVTEYCKKRLEELKAHFLAIFRSANHPLFRDDEEKVWQLFLDRYYLRTMQLRANIVDVRECCNVPKLAEVMQRPIEHFYRIPMSSELVIGLSPEGTFINLEIPSRLLFLDMLLMLQHAQECHRVLEEWAKNPNSPEPISHRTRLDAYVRQVILAGASTCEAILTDYGFLVEAIGDLRGTAMNLKNFSGGGLTKKLDEFLDIWSETLKLPKPSRPPVVDDMLKLVQVRNRLVHYDGRVSAWHALHIDFHWLVEQGFSKQVGQYLHHASYGLPDTFIGYEVAFAQFCIDTVLQTIDVIHCTVFPQDTEAHWMDIPRTPSGCVDSSAVVSAERMLKL